MDELIKRCNPPSIPSEVYTIIPVHENHSHRHKATTVPKRHHEEIRLYEFCAKNGLATEDVTRDLTCNSFKEVLPKLKSHLKGQRHDKASKVSSDDTNLLETIRLLMEPE